MAPSVPDAQHTEAVVLVVDDDPDVRAMLGYALRQHGLQPDEASSGEEALHILKQREPNVVLLDVLMPGLDGLETCERIRQFSMVPVIMLTALGRQEDVVAGLKAGADDYCAKPVNLSELAARIRAQLRREMQAVPKPADVLTAGEGDLVIDVRGGEVLVKSRAVRLSPREFRLLHRLAQTPGRPVSHEAVLDHVWGTRSRKGSNLRRYIHRLRRKIEPDPGNPRYILARARVGYVLTV